MPRYLRLLVVFCIAQFCVLVAATMFAGQSSPYISAINDKGRLLAATPSPRLILVGGSNLAFGVDSSELHAGLDAEFNVVNMGLHAGLGLDFMLAEALAEVRHGDVVVVSPEYAIMWSDDPEPVTLAQAVYYRPEAWRNVAMGKHFWSVAAAVLEAPGPILHDVAFSAVYRITPLIGSGRPRVYFRDAFSSQGDNLAARKLPGTLRVPEDAQPESFSTRQLVASIEAIESFRQHAEERGARVAFSYPPVPQYWWELNRTRVDSTHRMLVSATGLPVLGTPALEVYGERDFFDTEYHLRGHAVQVRTQHLLSSLKLWLRQ